MPRNPLIADDMQGTLEVLASFRRGHRSAIGALLVELGYWESLAEAARLLNVNKGTMTRARNRLLGATRIRRENINDGGHSASSDLAPSATRGDRQKLSNGVNRHIAKGKIL